MKYVKRPIDMLRVVPVDTGELSDVKAHFKVILGVGLSGDERRNKSREGGGDNFFLS